MVLASLLRRQRPWVGSCWTLTPLRAVGCSYGITEWCGVLHLQGEEYVNSRTLTDVTFHVEGRPFYAHRIALLASSEAFRAMFGQVRGRKAGQGGALLCTPTDL